MMPYVGADVSNVKVVVRVRPETSSEFESSTARSVVKVLDSQVLVFDPKDDEEDFFYHGKCQKHRNLLKRENREVRFIFDRIFDETALNPLVYENTTCGLLEGLLNGYNCTVFAYGATGAGKTYTMLGNLSSPGIIYLTVKDLFERIEEIKHEKTCEVAVSYLEVYNETIKDLLAPSGSLSIREDPKRGVTVSGLSLQKPKDCDQLFAMLERGNKNRSQHPTDANAESSRSHAVFTVHIRQRDRLGDISENVRLAKMCLVDLAGSERATMVSRNKKERIREGANINKSLLALGSCINALADRKAKLQYVPYRNSKLTHLLKDSLGGNCRTIMIATIAPSSLSYEDTYNTLKYAERAKHIKVNLKKNEVNIDNHMTKYPKLVEDLRQEVTVLKMKLQEYEDGRIAFTPCVPNPFGSPKIQEVTRLKDVITDVFLERRRLRKDALELESAIRNIDVRIHCRQAQCDRLALMSINSLTLETSTAKADSTIRTLQVKKERLEEKREVVLHNIAQNKERIVRVEAECKMIDPDGTVPELLTEIHSRNRAEVELAEARLETEHVKQFARISMKENEKIEKLLNKILPLTRNLYLILKGHGYATNDIQQDFGDLVNQLESTKEVGWADWAGTDSSDTYGNVLDLQHVLNLPITENIQFTPATGRLRRRSRRRTGGLSQANSPRRQISMEVDPETPRDKVTSTVQTPLQTPTASSHNATFSASSDHGSNDMSGVFEMNATTPLQRSLESTFILESDLPPSPVLSSHKPSILRQPETVETSPKIRRLTFDAPLPAESLCLDSISDETVENEGDSKENLNETFVKPAPIQRLPRALSNAPPMRVLKPQPSNSINTAAVRKNIEDLKRLGLPSVYEAVQDTAFRGPLRVRQEPLRIRSRRTRFSRLSSHPYAVSRMKFPPSSASQTRSTSRLVPTPLFLQACGANLNSFNRAVNNCTRAEKAPSNSFGFPRLTKPALKKNTKAGMT